MYARESGVHISRSEFVCLFALCKLAMYVCVRSLNTPNTGEDIREQHIYMFTPSNQNSQHNHNVIVINRQINIIPKHYIKQPPATE